MVKVSNIVFLVWMELGQGLTLLMLSLTVVTYLKHEKLVLFWKLKVVKAVEFHQTFIWAFFKTQTARETRNVQYTGAKFSH